MTSDIIPQDQQIDITEWLRQASRSELRAALGSLEWQGNGSAAELPDGRVLTDELCEYGIVVKQEAIREIREELGYKYGTGR